MAWVGKGDEPRFLFKISEVELELSVIDFRVHEKLSSPFEGFVSLACEEEIQFEDVVGKEALLTILGDEEERHVHGIVSQFRQTGSKGRFYLYQARMDPSLWLLSLEQDCRIFQEKGVQDIVKQILQEGGITADRFEFRLQNQYPVREYCVQYRETDLDFISRLLEEEGIFYFFEHAQDKHVLVFGDSPVVYKPIKGEAAVVYNFSPGKVPEEEFVYKFSFSSEVWPGKSTLRDFNFKRPSLNLTAQARDESFPKLEIYDYPGIYLDQERGNKLTQIRLQEAGTLKDKAEGASACSRFLPGFTFKLADHEREDFNQEYLLIEILHQGSQPQVLEEEAGTGGSMYSNDFLGIPSTVTFRPWRKTPKPVVKGLQTAMVVGPKGEEIYTDEYGRVKVQFHWEREGKNSCWVRVASHWAGGSYGVIFTPRIGQEVIVDFLEGDPDQPLITGRVYNAETMPPYKLPDQKTKSTIKSNSSTGGDGFNEIRFEDKKGEEQIFIHAEKDVDFRVKNDRREWVGNDRHLVVKRDKLEQVERDKHVKVEGEEFEEITRDHHLKIGGKEAIEVGGSRSVTVSGNMIEVFKGSHSEQVTQSYNVKGMNVVIEGMTQLTIKVGGNFIDINPAGIFIQGTMVMINSGGAPGMGMPLVAVPPALPLAAAIAADAVPGKDKTYDDAPTHKEPTEEEKQKKSWIEIELVDEEGNPVPGEKYKVTLPDGKTVAKGTLDEKGFARIEGIDPGTCKITFPNLDKDAWEKA